MSLLMPSIRILGAYGTKSPTCGSSAFLVNDKHTIDAGNILIPLNEKSVDIETIWLTHSHLDHISDIAFMLDNYYAKRTKSLCIRGLKATLNTLKTHFFNHKIWPDFSQIPLSNGIDMCLVYEEISLGIPYSIADSCYIEAFATDHTVPSCGYIITQADKSVLISADTYSLETVIEAVKHKKDISSLVIECSFPSSLNALAKESKHLTPELLFSQLKQIKNEKLKLYINHMKPSYIKEISDEIEILKGEWDVTLLTDGALIYF